LKIVIYRPGPMQTDPLTWSGGEPSSHTRCSAVPWQTRPTLFIFNFVFSIFYFSEPMNREELRKRTKEFAHRCVKLAMALPDTPLGRHIRSQLIRCGTSVSANYRAACIAQSRASFAAKLNIVLEETDESCFWFEFVIDEKLLPQSRVVPLLNEGKELTSIFVSSTKTLRTSKLKIENRK